MKPTFSPTCGGGGVAGRGGVGGTGGTATGSGAFGAGVGTDGVGAISSFAAGSTSGCAGATGISERGSVTICGTSTVGEGAAGALGALTSWGTGWGETSSAMGISAAAGGAGSATFAIGRSCSSRYSAVILSSELEGTLAVAMPNSLALASTDLLSKPSFFA